MKKLRFVFVVAWLLVSCSTTKNIIILERLDSSSLKGIPSGSHVRLEPKTYKLATQLRIEDKENITIDGNGATLLMQSMEDDVVYIGNSRKITLKNIKATHIEPRGPTGCTGNVIHIEDGADVLIERCELNGSGIVGIAAYRTKNLQVIHNYIHKNSEYGIIYQGASIEIKKNTFANNGRGHLYFSCNDTSWPPQHLINADENREGLKMKGNVFR